MFAPRHAVVVLGLVLSAVGLAGGQAAVELPAGQDASPAPSDQVAALQTFVSHFPEIQSTLGSDPCSYCGCITVNCYPDDNNISQPTYMYVGRTGINGMSINCDGYVDCSDTAFDVTLPQNAFASLYLPSLTSLSVADSRPLITTGVLNLKGALPDSLPEALPALEELVFQGTGLSGEIPTDWFQEGAWQDLETLQLHNNYALTGTVPDLPSGALPQLLDYSITNGLISGALPFVGPREDESGGSGLALYLQNLTLTGTLPADFAQGANLSYLCLGDNALTGTLPPSWGSEGYFGPLLSFLNLTDNSLTGAIPDTWGSQIDGQSEGQFTLDLSSNSLSGSVPASFDGGERSEPDLLILLPGNDGLCGATPAGAQLTSAAYDYTYSYYGDYDGTYNYTSYGYYAAYDYGDEGPADNTGNITLPAC